MSSSANLLFETGGRGAARAATGVSSSSSSVQLVSPSPYEQYPSAYPSCSSWCRAEERSETHFASWTFRNGDPRLSSSRLRGTHDSAGASVEPQHAHDRATTWIERRTTRCASCPPPLPCSLPPQASRPTPTRSLRVLRYIRFLTLPRARASDRRRPHRVVLCSIGMVRSLRR